MPVRSSASSVLAWPDRSVVDAAVRQWAQGERLRCPALLAVGYFGSYARGQHGVGSDVDLVLLVSDSARPFAERALDWDTTHLPVPADLLVYTRAEWNGLMATGSPFSRRLHDETVWVLEAEGSLEHR